MQSRPFLHRPVAKVGLALVATTSLASVYAFKTVFARPGEDALRLAPSNSFLVASIDLSPSPSQALVFKRIDDSLSKLDKTNILEASLLDAFAREGGGEKLRPYVTRHGAVAVMANGSDTKDVSGAVMMAVSDSGAVEQILKKTGRTEFWKGSMYYRIPKFRMGLMLKGDTLVLADQPWVMHEIDRVAKKEAKSVLENPEFLAARAKAIPDANAMVFVNPQIFGDQMKEFMDPTGSWYNASMAIRDGGIEFKVSTHTDFDKNPLMKAFADIQPVRKDLYDALPSGAYGVMAISQPGKIYEGAEASFKKVQDVERGLTEFDNSLQKDLGMSIHGDIVPAFKGSTVLAIYPKEGGEVTGVNALAVIDDSNGGTPSAAAEKLVKFIDEQAKKSSEAKSRDWSTTINIEGAKAWRLSDDIQSDMRRGIFGGDTKGVNKDDLVGDKTVAWAHVGNVVIASTSEALLRRAVATYRTHTGNLSGDAVFAEGAQMVPANSQSLMSFDLSRMATGVKNSVVMSDMSTETAKGFRQVLGLFEDLKSGLTMGGRGEMDGNGEMKMFVPVNYEKMIALLDQKK